MSLVFAQGGPPSTESLLALPRVHCRAGARVWRRTDDAHRWTFAVDGVVVATGLGEGAFELTREVRSPATRAEVPGSPWTWTERVRVTPLAAAEIREGLPGVDEVFACVDRTDPSSSWVDVGMWWDGASPPGPGLRRCATERRDVVWVETNAAGGVPPPPGRITGARTLVMDGRVVGREVRREPLQPGWKDERDDFPAAGPVVVEELRVSTLGAREGVERTRVRFRFTRPDGSGLFGGESAWTGDLVCEVGRFSSLPP